MGCALEILMDNKEMVGITIIILVLAIIAFTQLQITGQATAVIDDPGTSGATTTLPAGETTTTTWPGSCGNPCPLAGGVGILDIDDNCIGIQEYYDNRHCCINDDCGRDGECSLGGLCG